MIDGVKVKNLKVICDSRGRLMEMLRKDDEIFTEFGQIYMTTTYPGVVKGWHSHKLQTDKIVCVAGMLKLVLCDKRKGSKTFDEINEFYLGEHNPLLIHVPKEVHHGWMCIGDTTAVVINVPDKTYNYKEPDESRLPPHNNDLIKYNWHNIDK